MSTLITINNFEEIYHKTYKDLLRYIVCKCQNLEDVNELIQDTYVQFYQMINKKKVIKVNDEKAYLIGIAKNIVKRYYRNQYQEKANRSYFANEEIPANCNLEIEIVNKENIEEIWNYLNHKNVLIAKIFYLYSAQGLKIVEIAEEFQIKESTIKNYIYRTLKELNQIFRKEGK